MKWMRVVLVTALLVQVLYLPCSAQGSVKIVDDTDWAVALPGERVRIKAPSVSKHRLIGTAVTVDADTLMLRSDKPAATPLAISLASVTKLEVSQGRKSNTGKGAVIGLLVGVGAGFPLGYAVGPFEGDDYNYSRGPARRSPSPP